MHVNRVINYGLGVYYTVEILYVLFQLLHLETRGQLQQQRVRRLIMETLENLKSWARRLKVWRAPFSNTFYQFFSSTEQINPQVLEGCKVSLGKGLSRYFQTTHTVTLGTSQPASYQYGVTYVGSKKLSENDVSCQLV